MRRTRLRILFDRVAAAAMLLVAMSFVRIGIWALRQPSHAPPKVIGGAIAFGIIGAIILTIVLIDFLRGRNSEQKND